MAIVPLPDINRSGLFEGLLYGNKERQARQQMAQDWQIHLQNAQIRKLQEQRLAEELLMNKELHPYAVRKAQQEESLYPWQQDYLQAQIADKKASAEARGKEHPLKARALEAKIKAEEAKAKSYQYKETPEQKREAARREFEYREKVKAENKNTPSNKLTTPLKTNIQKSILAVDTIYPLMQDIAKEEVPSAIFGKLTPNQQALVNAMSNLGIDELSSIFSLSKDQLTTHKLEQMVSRQPFESEDAFKKRFGYLMKRIAHKRELGVKALKSGEISLDAIEENEGDKTKSKEKSEKIWNPKTRNWENG